MSVPRRPTTTATATAVTGPVRSTVVAATLVVVALLAAACGGSSSSQAGPSDDTTAKVTTVRVLTHDSFSMSDEVLADFEAESGIRIEIVSAGDAVQVVNQAVLTAGKPQGDVLFGIDNNTLTRAYDADLFVPYASPALADVPAELQLDPEHRVTPVDVGDVCLNYDRAWFADAGVPVPTTLGGLADPRYKDLLVVENPSTSTPGLAFLLATVAEYGPDGWQAYWKDLQTNGVAVADGWETAYNDLFSANGRSGNRPLVVSYASSPPFEVADPATTPADQAPTGVIPGTCYRQIEFAGILRGSSNVDAAQQVIDFLLSVPFQTDVPEQMYVYPANERATLPEIFTTYSTTITDPYQLTPEDVGANSSTWVVDWTRLGIG